VIEGVNLIKVLKVQCIHRSNMVKKTPLNNEYNLKMKDRNIKQFLLGREY
jgi:hypothetical protein